VTVSAVVIAKDEAAHIGGCLAGLGWADERLVVLDAATTDSTAEVALAAGARVEGVAWRGFSGQRNAALDLANGDWVLFVDADERVIPALAAEVRRIVDGDAPHVGYWIPRRNVIVGEWVRHAGWHPDRQLRLMRRDSARYDEERAVHELAMLDGSAGDLRNPLIHLNYVTWGEFREKQRRYALLDARRRFADGERARARSLVGQPIRQLIWRAWTLGGVRQGLTGLRLSAEMALAQFETYRELRRLGRGTG
jgi:glycosyltransferase involved in cell wall biosynthesis